MPDTHAPQQLEPWQWPEAHWRKLVNQVRAGRAYRPKSWKGGARCAVALSFDSDHETNELRDGGESIGNAQTQRELRPDNGEVDLFSFSERPRGFRVGQVDRHGAGKLGHTRVSGGGDDLADVAFRGQPGDQCVLARAAAENENSHRMSDL